MKNLIFLKPITCERTSTSPWDRAACASAPAASMRSLAAHFQHAHLRVADGVGVVVHIHALHIRFPLLEIERLDVKLLPLMKINRLGMHGCERAGEIDFADHFGPRP